MEIWKPLVNFENEYIISNFGIIKRLHSDEIVKQKIKNNYYYVRLSSYESEFRVHRLVAQTFIKNITDKKIFVNHKNGNKLDNCVDNLEYVTPSENVKHAVENGLQKLTSKRIGQFDKNGILIKEYTSINEACKETGIDDGTICKVCKGKNKSGGGFIWKYLDDNPTNKQENIKKDDLTLLKDFPNYGITRDGKIYSHLRNRFLTPKDHDGYTRYYLSNGKSIKAIMIHKLLAEVFIPNPDNKKFVYHINKNKKDNRVENLKWK